MRWAILALSFLGGCSLGEGACPSVDRQQLDPELSLPGPPEHHPMLVPDSEFWDSTWPALVSALLGAPGGHAREALENAGWAVRMAERPTEPTTLAPHLRTDMVLLITCDGLVVEILYN